MTSLKRKYVNSDLKVKLQQSKLLYLLSVFIKQKALTYLLISIAQNNFT